MYEYPNKSEDLSTDDFCSYVGGNPPELYEDDFEEGEEYKFAVSLVDSLCEDMRELGEEFLVLAMDENKTLKIHA